MKKNLMFIACLAVVFLSCQNEIIPTPGIEGTHVKVTSLSQEEATALAFKQSGATISEDEALEKAALFFDGVATKSNGFDLQTYWIPYYNQTSLTKSVGIGTPDSIPVYLINKNDGSSVLLAGDRRVPEVLAFADSPLSMTETNTGADVFISNLPAFVNYKINEFNAKYDSLLAVLKEKGIELVNPIQTKATDVAHFSKEETMTTPWEEVFSYSPLLNVKWGQGYPYNLATEKIQCDNEMVHPPLGCVTIAVGQILSFHKYPTRFDGTNIDWVGITKSPNITDFSPYAEQVQKMLFSIAKGVHMEFGCDGSASNIYKAKSYLDEIGYISDAVSTYNDESVINSISNSRPIFVRGETVPEKEDEKVGGHAWIIDGANKKDRRVISRIYEYRFPGPPPEVTLSSDWILIKETETEQVEEYVHCNYGYEGLYDGYYHHAVFSLTDDMWGSGPFFKANLLILTNIKRK